MQFFDNYFEDGKPVGMLEGLHLTNSSITTLLEFIQSAPLFGVKASYPESVSADDAGAMKNLLSIAASVWTQVKSHVALAESKLAEATAAIEDNIAMRRLTEATKAVLGKGERNVEILKQDQNSPFPVEEQIAISISPDAQPGSYDLLIGMYTQPDIQRLPTSGPRAQDTAILLTKIQILP